MKPIIFLAFANDKVDNARYLRNLPLELDGIRKALQPAINAGLCDLIERANVSIEQIFDVFQSYQDRIAIFHYGGHADGYQLLLETLSTNSVSGSEANKVAHGEGLVSFFARQRGLQLVFFNGCSTQQQSLELVKAGIPAVIGTSNSINDDIATTLSIRFYSGLAKGASIEKAWAEATDEVKMREGTANLRGLYRKAQSEVVADRLPWEIYYREGAEKVKEWNLPEEVDNPLFGLPNIPPTFALPESPFLFLKRYERPHAELFFGRSFYVRELYNKITDPQSPPVILLYGQSGTGKSSLFDAGLNPRLENSHHVIYLRRNQVVGLVGTLEEGLMFSPATASALSVSPQTTAGKEETAITALEVNRRLQVLQILKNQILSIAASEKINLSETIEILESELLFVKTQTIAEETTAEEFSVKTQTTAALSPFGGGGAGGGLFNEQKFLTQVGKTPFFNLLKAWHTLENQFQKPLVVILDQAEELFTRPNKQINNELENLAQCLRMMFNNPAFAPQGKLILGYRKEYQAEFEERFKECAIPRTKVFLEPLSRKDILDIFKGLTETPNLKKRYNLQIDKNLPVVIADDLLEDKDSPVAPVLQILLTKMWDKVKDHPKPIFTVEMYQNLKKEGFLLDDFFKQQTQKLAESNPELERSGLFLDILNYHTTNLGTAGSKTLEEIRAHYCHIPEKAELLLYKLKELYLLVEAGQDRTNLTHDTLAPLVRNEFRKSERAGQRASRILDNQLNDFLLNERQVLDELEVEIVEKGKEGMRIWREEETKFVTASQAARDEKEKARKRRKRYAVAALSMILITALFSVYQWHKSSKNADEAKMKELMLLAGRMMENKDDSSTIKGKALRLAEQAVIFAEHEENEEKMTIYEDFRKLSETYRTEHEQGSFWLPPYQEINYNQAPYNFDVSQNKMQDEAFMEYRGRSAEFAKVEGDAPIFPVKNPEVSYKNTLDGRNLVIWIKNHSFRIFPYLRSKDNPTQIIKADPTITDFLAISSTHWFVKDNYDQIKAYNVADKSYQFIAKLTQDSATNINRFHFVKYDNQDLVVWYDRFMFKISPNQNANWENAKMDTLYELGSGELYDALNQINSSAKIVFSNDLSRFVVYMVDKATLFAKEKEDSTYKVLEIRDFLTTNNIAAISFSKNLDKVCFANSSDNFSLYDLQIDRDDVSLEEVFNKSIRISENAIHSLQISPAREEHILLKTNTQEARIYDLQGNMIDIYKIDPDSYLDNYYFSDDGSYILDYLVKKINEDYSMEKIILRMPIYDLADWIDITDAKELSPNDKLSYEIASLSEQWGIPKTRLELLAQALSFLTILLLLIRYIPILIQLYKEERYYKIVLYGLATLIFAYAVIYKEFFTEIEDNFINQASEFFIILSLYYLLVILFEQRQEIVQFIKEKNWTSLALFTAPEIILISINVYAVYYLWHHGEWYHENITIIVSLLYPFNSLVLWTIHLSETSFKQGNYIKTLGLLLFGFAYIVLFSNLYATNNISEEIIVLFLFFPPIIWFCLWAGRYVYHSIKKKFGKKDTSLLQKV